MGASQDNYTTKNGKSVWYVDDEAWGNPTKQASNADAWSETDAALLDIIGPLPGNQQTSAVKTGITNYKMGLPLFHVVKILTSNTETKIIDGSEQIPGQTGRAVVDPVTLTHRYITAKGLWYRLTGSGAAEMPYGERDEYPSGTNTIAQAAKDWISDTDPKPDPYQFSFTWYTGPGVSYDVSPWDDYTLRLRTVDSDNQLLYFWVDDTDTEDLYAIHEGSDNCVIYVTFYILPTWATL